MPSPGAIAPPRNSPFLETTSNVVAVPMSTTMQGPPSCSNAATQLTTRSAPTSLGLSVSTGRPVLHTRLNEQRLHMEVGISHTQPQCSHPAAAPRKRSPHRSTQSVFKSRIENSICSSTPSSSESLLVRRRDAPVRDQSLRGHSSVACRNKPITVFEFPTSSASSMCASPPRLNCEVTPRERRPKARCASRRHRSALAENRARRALLSRQYIRPAPAHSRVFLPPTWNARGSE